LAGFTDDGRGVASFLDYVAYHRPSCTDLAGVQYAKNPSAFP
jgi:hypothetical protein